ncbi:hypothetical protein D3C77_799020 [compost metagenome]
MVVLVTGAGLDLTIGAVGPGQRQGEDQLATADARQPALLLLLRGKAGDTGRDNV